MNISNNNEHFLNLRKQYPYFIFEKYDIKYKDAELYICFHFNLSDKINFYPKIRIP